LDLIDKLTPETGALFVLKDYDNFLKDYSIIRKLKNLSRNLKTQPKNIIILSSEINVPDSLKEFITVLNFPLPSYEEKKQIIQQTQLLEFCLTDKSISDLGGLDNFKDWLKLRSKAFSQEAVNYGLPFPKGLLLVGVQGTGKSVAAKIIAHEWQLPLLRLDFGRLFASLIGQSEQRVRKMIEIAEALSPCVLWVDEIDKAFAGAQSSGDSGTTSRVLATFITWLSEKTSPVFVVSTANNIEFIPPEILRKGRFDEMFFLTLPTREERQAIFNVHLKRFRPDSAENFEIPLLSELSKDFSGAEIEQVVIEAMRLGFNEDREFNNADILISIQNLVPLAKTKSAEINLLKQWSESGNVTSASKYI